MGHLAVWKTQEEMLVDLRKRGFAIPEKIMNDLKTARIIIKISKAETNPEDAAQNVEIYLANIESFLITEAEKRFGTKYADEWLKRLSNAGRTIDEPEDKTRFVPGLPREYKWLRVKLTAGLPLRTLETIANELELTYKTQYDGYLLIYGKDKPIRDFVKKMTAKQSSKTGQQR
jgi:hypothetical protein